MFTSAGLYSIFSCLCFVKADINEKRLLDSVLSNYDSRVRPVENSSQPMIVRIDYSFHTILDLNERDQVLTCFGWLLMGWYDYTLQWNATDYGNIKSIIVDTTKIWHPDMVVRNSVDEVYGEILDFSKFRSVVSSDGTVFLASAGKTFTSCVIDVTYFPLDVQTCFIRIENWVHTVDEMAIRNISDKVTTDRYKSSGQWELVDTTSMVYNETYGTITYSSLVCVFYFSRKPLFYTTTFLFPCMMMSILVVLVFSLPVESGEKITLGITILLSLSVFQLMIVGNMPKTSDYFPVISIYILCVMVLSTLSLLLTIIVLAIHHQHPNKKLSHWTQVLVFDIIAKLIGMSTEVKNILSDEHDAKWKGDRKSSLWSTALNKIFDTSSCQNSFGAKIIPVENVENGNSGEKTKLDTSGGRGDEFRTPSKSTDSPKSKTLSSFVPFLKGASDQQLSAVTTKWNLVALILDKLFFYLFIASSLLMMFILGMAYIDRPSMREIDQF